jgi:RsiW-degrading membrane proteinase PrsW (M82 family)
MNKNLLYLALGALLIVVVGLGVYIYQEETKPQGLEIQIDQSGISIEEN